MQRIIDRKIYDTERSALIAEAWPHDGPAEELYLTDSGEFFTASEAPDELGGGIKPLTPRETEEWLVARHCADAIRKFFPESDIEEA